MLNESKDARFLAVISEPRIEFTTVNSHLKTTTIRKWPRKIGAKTRVLSTRE